jgi:hypothetical protein
MDKGTKPMTNNNHQHEEWEEDPNAKFFSEIFTTDQDIEMNTIDFNVFIDTLIAWVDEEEKIDPSIARYMGMTLLGIAEKLDRN